MKRLALVIAAPIALTACNSDDLKEAPVTYNIVKEEITLKSLKTGIKPNRDFKRAYTADWTYFGRPRVVSYKTNNNGKVMSLKFNLDHAWDAYKIKEALAEKFKTDGNSGFRFRCESDRRDIKFGNKRYTVTDEDCYAKDGRQTLHIYSRNPVYEVPEAKYSRLISALVDAGKLALYDESMQKAHDEEEHKKLMIEIEKDNKKAIKDI